MACSIALSLPATWSGTSPDGERAPRTLTHVTAGRLDVEGRYQSKRALTCAEGEGNGRSISWAIRCGVCARARRAGGLRGWRRRKCRRGAIDAGCNAHAVAESERHVHTVAESLG